MTTDMTAVVFVFPNEDSESVDVLPFFWFPEAKARKFEIKLSVPLKEWADRGLLELSEGEAIDYRDVRARIEWGVQMFDVEQVLFDPWNSKQMSGPMIDDGYHCAEVRQGYPSLNEPTKKIIEMVACGSLHHGGHPILRWQAGCACTIADRNGNRMFSKPDIAKSASRIDGISAMATAMFGVISNESRTINYSGLRTVGSVG